MPVAQDWRSSPLMQVDNIFQVGASVGRGTIQFLPPPKKKIKK